MELLPIDLATLVTTLPSGGVQMGVVVGDRSQLLEGQIYSGLLTPGQSGMATLNLGGSPLTVRIPSGVSINPNLPLLVKVVPGTGRQTLELMGEWIPTPSPKANGTVNRGITGSLVRAVVQQSPDGQPRILIAGKSVPVQGLNLTPGQTIVIRLPSNQAQALAAETVISTEVNPAPQPTTTKPSTVPGPQAAPTNKPNPAPGAQPALPVLVQAQVIRALPQGKFLVQVNGKSIAVSTEEPLPLGAKVLGRIEASAKGPVLRLDPPEQVSAGEIGTAILKNQPERQALGTVLQTLAQSLPKLLALAENDPILQTQIETLHTTLEKVTSTPDATPTEAHLAQFVRDGGLQYEAKLARQIDLPTTAQDTSVSGDLKGALLATLDAARQLPASQGTSHPLEAVRQAADAIEAQQALNLLAQVHGEPYQLQFPLVQPGPWPTLNLSVERDPQESRGSATADPERFQLLMHLNLSEFGATWVDARITPHGIHALLYVEKTQGRQQAVEGIAELDTALRGLGYGSVSLEVYSAAELPVGPASARFHALEAGMPESVSMIDRRA